MFQNRYKNIKITLDNKGMDANKKNSCRGSQIFNGFKTLESKVGVILESSEGKER
jgi:hypothetical protein